MRKEDPMFSFLTCTYSYYIIVIMKGNFSVDEANAVVIEMDAGE
jgi:hypothetical protein